MYKESLVPLLSIGSICLVLMTISCNNKNSPFAFGVIADCQYCDDPGSGVRKYAASENKLNKCVSHLNKMDLEYVIHLGDFIDRDINSFDVVTPIYNQLKMPK